MRQALLVAMVLGTFPPPAAAQDPMPILERSSRIYQDLHSLEATSDQMVDYELIWRLESLGQLYQLGKSRMALRFEDPPTEASLIAATFPWVFSPAATPNQSRTTACRVA